MVKKIGLIGSGIVAQTLGVGFIKHGYEVMLGTRDTSKLNNLLTGAGHSVRVGSFAETGEFADLIVLAVKGTAAIAAVELIGNQHIKGKTIIDVNNPISDAAPENGVLRFFTNLDESLMEQLQEKFPEANFVKAFSSVGSANMVNPDFETKPTMFICGNNAAAKSTVTDILDQFGWETADMGSVEAARAIEPLCMLWCIPGFLNNEWTHAFKLLKK